MVTFFKVLFGFIAFILAGGIFFYIILDLKPWRKESRKKILTWLKKK
jgi:Trk-type K+ transport system membrane component